MPKSTPAPPFECGDGVWIHHGPARRRRCSPRCSTRLAPPRSTRSRPDRGRRRRTRNLDYDRTRKARAVVEPGVARELLGQRHLRPTGAPAGRPSPTSRRGTATSSTSTTPRWGGSPSRVCCSRSRRRRGCAARRPRRRDTDDVLKWKAGEPSPPADRARMSGRVRSGRSRGYAPLDLGNFLAGPYAGAAPRRPRRRRDQARVGGGRPDARRSSGRSVGASASAASRSTRAAQGGLRSTLVEWADIVHHNLRMPAVHRLEGRRRDPAQLKPDLIYRYTSLHGPTGPRRLARLRPTVPGVALGRWRARARATRPCGTGSVSWTTQCFLVARRHTARAVPPRPQL